MNEVMHGNDSSNLFSMNSLLQPNLWIEDVRKEIDLEFFDIIFANPPFGSKIPIDEPSTLSQYDLGHNWDNDRLEKKDKLASSVPPEELFIERCLQFLKPGGRLAIILPDSILSNPGKKYIRHWILKNAKVIASIDLPRETFQPHVGSKTSLLILQKKTLEEIRLEEAGK
jgi:type I restriction enzyme M protein